MAPSGKTKDAGKAPAGSNWSIFKPASVGSFAEHGRVLRAESLHVKISAAKHPTSPRACPARAVDEHEEAQSGPLG
eukprot:364950-Chlamydomonas_euryale.AAC.19